MALDGSSGSRHNFDEVSLIGPERQGGMAQIASTVFKDILVIDALI